MRKPAVAKLKQSFTNGQVIYHQGDVSDRAFEVLSGAIEMVSCTDGAEARVGVARAGDMFGESGLIEGGLRENTARAVGNVVVRAILRDAGNDLEISAGSGPGLMSRLFKRVGGKHKKTTSERSGRELAENQSSAGLIQRVINSVQPLEGRIEIRVAPLDGDEDRMQARHIATAMERFRDVRVKTIDNTMMFDLAKGLARELPRVGKSGRQLLCRHDADLLIWGHVPSPGTTVHLHFIARGDWDERLPGAFSLATDLSLPVNFDSAFADILHAVTLAATRPKRGEQTALRTTMMPEALEAATRALGNIPPDLTIHERAGLNLCIGSAYGALWAQTRHSGCLDRAFDIYRGVLTLLSGDEAAVDWAVAHKHLSAISVIRAEEDSDTRHYDEAAAAALVALDTLSKENYPADWAALQYRLGTIHYKLGFESGDTNILRRALHYHRNALRIYSKEKTPNRWAEAMAAFGQAAQVFGEHIKSLEALATAVNACRAVVEVRDRRRKPLAWAAAQNNLGSALFLLGKKARSPERLELAVAAFESALEVYRERELHRPAAVTGKNLERAQDMIEWYSPDGIEIVKLAGAPVAELAANQNQARSGQAIEVIE